MNLIERLYGSAYYNYNKLYVCSNESYVYFNDLDDVNKVMKFLKDTRCYDTDLSYEEFDSNLIKLFNRLCFNGASICLHDMMIGNSRYKKLDDGCCIWKYSVNSLECVNGDVLSYYSSGELFDGEDRRYPGVQLISGNTSLCYSLGKELNVKKYDIKVNDDLMITREFSKDSVLFILDNKINGRFVIKIDKPISKGVCGIYNMSLNGNYVLNNEVELVKFLMNVESYDVANIYNILSENFIGSDVSIYPEITISEMVNTENGVRDKNLLTIIDGKLDCAVRTIGDKTLTLHGDGNWSYVINDEYVNFRINSGKTFKYAIDAKNDKVMNDYTDTLLKYDVSKAKKEVEDTKKLVRALGIGVKRKG